MRLISADRAPTAFAMLRHVAVIVATSFMIVRGLREHQPEVFRHGLKQVERAGAFVEIDVRRQHAPSRQSALD